MSIENYRDFVKSQQDYHQHSATRMREKSPDRSQRHNELAQKFGGLLAAIDASLAKTSQAGDSAPSDNQSSLAPLPEGQYAASLFSNPVAILPEDLVGLPEELIEQLGITETDRFEMNVLNLVNQAAGKTMSLEKILLGLFHMTKEVHNRTQLANRLYRMTKKGRIYTVPGKKGIYTTQPPSSTESIGGEAEG